jgi:hypoxanthine phosphoribosyltransferase
LLTEKLQQAYTFGMTTTTERDPYLDIREEDVRVGPKMGFYPMPDGQLWVSAFMQRTDAMSLAEKIRLANNEAPFDIEMVLLKGAMSVAGASTYYNGAPIVIGMQTEQFITETTEDKLKRPRVVTMPDWDFIGNILQEKRIHKPRVLVRDDLSDQRRALQLAGGLLVTRLGIDPEDISNAVPYVKDLDPSELEGDETCADDVAKIHYSVREAGGLWLQHQTQVGPDILLQRQKDLEPFMPNMRTAAHFFEQFLLPVPEIMERVIARSAE